MLLKNFGTSKWGIAFMVEIFYLAVPKKFLGIPIGVLKIYSTLEWLFYCHHVFPKLNAPHPCCHIQVFKTS